MKNDISKTIDLDSMFKPTQPEPIVESVAEEIAFEQVSIDMNEILGEWSYRLPKGFPTIVNGVFTERAEVEILNKLLEERGLQPLPLPEQNIHIRISEEVVAAGDFEQIAVDLWNLALKNAPLDRKYNAFKDLYTEMSAIVKKVHINKQLEKFSGQRIPTSEFWIKNSGGKSKDEPKTDIKSDDNTMRISVKKGASQLMSPEKKEAIATFKAVAAASGLAPKAEKEVLDILNSFAERTVTIGFNTRELARVSAKELTGDKVNKKAKQVYDLAYKAHKLMEKKLNSLFKDNKTFERQFLYEAASGYIKFNNNPGTANYLLAISTDAKHVKLKKMYNANDEAITQILGKIKVSPSMKSNSYSKGSKKVGYGFYSSLRIHLEDVMSKTTKIAEVEDKLKAKKDLLNEAWYSDLLGKVKAFLLKIWNRLLKIAKWLQEKLEWIVGYVKDNFDRLLEVSEVEPQVSDDVLAPVDFY